MHLLIDAGNSRIKLAQYQSPKELKLLVFEQAVALKNFLEGLKQPGPLLVSNVGTWDLDFLEDFGQPLYRFTKDTPLPLTMAYRSPESLGLDRRALAVAAVSLFPQQNVLVFDAGTCLTGDFVDQSGSYRGGFISPGLAMRFRALHHYTAALPHEHWPEGSMPDYLGDSTVNSLRSGVVHGMIHEIEGQIARYQQDFKNLKLIITGGDAQRLLAPLKSHIFADPNFLLHGLDKILRHQKAHI